MNQNMETKKQKRTYSNLLDENNRRGVIVSAANVIELDKDSNFFTVLPRDIWITEIIYKNLLHYLRTLACVSKDFYGLVSAIRKSGAEAQLKSKELKRKIWAEGVKSGLSDKEIKMKFIEEEKKISFIEFNPQEHTLQKDLRSLDEDFFKNGIQIRNSFFFLKDIYLHVSSEIFVNLKNHKRQREQKRILHEQNQDFLIERACKSGCIEFLKYLNDEGFLLNTQKYQAMVANANQGDIFKWIRNKESRCEILDRDVIFGFVKNDNFEMVKWCFGDYFKNTITNLENPIFECVAEKGNLSMFKFLRAHDPTCDLKEDVCYNAARSGNLELLKWLTSQTPPEDWKTVYRWKICPMGEYIWQAASGKVEILEWLKTQNIPLRSPQIINKLISDAIYSENIDMKKWLQDNKISYAFDKDLCIEFAARGDLKNLQLARQKNWPWDERVLDAAIEEENLDIIKWCLTQTPPCPSSSTNVIKAIRKENFEIVKCLFNHNVESNYSFHYEICVAAVEIGDLEMLKWLRSPTPPDGWDLSREWKPCCWHTDVLMAAAQYKQLEIFKWAFENGCPITQAIKAKARKTWPKHVL